MIDFGLACEGATDHITIENILCGFFDQVDDLDDQIVYLQPPLDETNRKQQDFGGWQLLLKYLSSERFRDDVLNTRYLIIQVDTDISKDIGFDVPHTDENNTELSVEALVKQVETRIAAQITQGENGFYDQHQHKIVFCITVHSIECWLLAYYNPQTPKNPKTKGCEKALKHVLVKYHKQKDKAFIKQHRYYDGLSRPLTSKKTLLKTATKDPSLAIFIKHLTVLNYPA